jgi:hypothetical protein
MGVVALPLLTDQTPHYAFECELEGKTYTFEFLWNDRDGAWYMMIGDSQENPLTGFLRVVLGKSFTAAYTNPALPPGAFFAKDTSGQHADASLGDLGARVQIWYVESSSLASLAASGTF